MIVGSVVWGFDENREVESWELKLFTALSMILQSMVPNQIENLEIAKKINKVQEEPAMLDKNSSILETKYQMTPRQVEIARMIADGASNREIAQALFFSESMARYETVKIYERLRVKNRAQAAGVIRSIL